MGKGEADGRYQTWMDNFYILDPQVYDLQAKIDLTTLEKCDESTRESCFHKGEELSGFQLREVTRQSIEKSAKALDFEPHGTTVKQLNHHDGLVSLTIGHGPLSVRFSTVFGIFETIVPKR